MKRIKKFKKILDNLKKIAYNNSRKWERIKNPFPK